MARRPGIKDVAALAGVSPATVSRALNQNLSNLVATETRERVLAAVEALDYFPNPLAVGMQKGRSLLVGLMIDGIANAHVAGRQIDGVQSALWDNGMLVAVADAAGGPDREQRVIRRLHEGRVDGVIYAATSYRIVSLESDVPLVLLNAVSAAGGVRCVFSDDVGGAENAVSQLVAAGHRRIGFIGPAGEQPTVANRLCGFRQALAGAGVPADPEWIALAGEGTAQGGRRAVQRLLQLTTRPSAIICHDDHMAIGAYQAANDLDLDVPLDLSIIGFDDDDPTVAEALSPALTTITLPHLEMGSRAGQAILGQLGQFAMDVEGEGPSTSVPCVLNIRASVTGPTLG